MNAPTLRILAAAHDFSARHPGGSALLRVLNGLAGGHTITCLSCGPRPPELDPRIDYHAAWAPRSGGMLLCFVCARISLRAAFERISRDRTFDVVQTIDSECGFGNVVTFHCCHAAYRDTMRPRGLLRGRGLRGLLGNLQIRTILALRIAIERRVCRSPRTRAIVALSAGSARDIVSSYRPLVAPVVIPNSIA